MSNESLKSAIGAGAPDEGGGKKTAESAIVRFDTLLTGFLPQLQLALPSHLKPTRMKRLAMTAFSSTPHLSECSPRSVLASLITAAQLGLEPGVNGQGWLIPYFNTKARGYECQFVPGWKGLLDLVSRSGRAGAWTGCVYRGDQFDYALGDRPFVMHKPGDALGDLAEITHVYGVGRVNGAEWPVVEVWPIAKVWKHRDRYNRQGERHYGFREPEMYARKVPLLQVLKYLPSSIEIAAAIALADRQDQGLTGQLDTSGMVIFDTDGSDGVVPPPPPPADAAPAATPAPRPRAPKPPKGGAAADASVAEPLPPAAPGRGDAGGPGFTAADYVQQVQNARDQDDAVTALDLARSELPADAAELVRQAFAARFPPKG